jgi:glucosamine--fructose-6-phosphate aminotransferase (isomerizing)
VAERFSTADFLHGPIAMVERDFPVILFAPPGRALPDLVGMLSRLKELKADTLVISGHRNALDLASRAIRMPGRIPDLYSAIPYIIPGQLFAAKLSLSRGLRPESPRGLSKITRTL